MQARARVTAVPTSDFISVLYRSVSLSAAATRAKPPRSSTACAPAAAAAAAAAGRTTKSAQSAYLQGAESVQQVRRVQRVRGAGEESAPHRPASSAPPPPRTRPLAATASRPLLLPSASLRGISRHSAKVRCRVSVADDGEAPAPGASEVSLCRHSVTASPWGSATVTPAAVRAKQAPGPSRWS